jgi:dihydropyrimidinase
MLLAGGTVLDVDGERRADLQIGTDGRIRAVGLDLDRLAGETIIDCRNRLLVPGGVDVHTHLHLPVGNVRVSDDFATGTVAAAIGGTITGST